MSSQAISDGPVNLDGFEARLLDVLVTQWSVLGVPLHPAFPTERLEIVDPECLLWASLPYLDRDARLAEGVRAWVAANTDTLNWTRLNRVTKGDANGPRLRALTQGIATAGHRGSTPKPLASRIDGPSTILLRAREILGNDIRSFLIVHLLAHPRGVRLRAVASATWYAYRSVSQTVATWEHAGLVAVNHGHCVLLDPSPWRDLLKCRGATLSLIDWKPVFDAARDLLHTLARGRELGFPASHPLLLDASAKARTALRSTTVGIEEGATPSLCHLLAGL
jgi:hypothetical protein